MTLREIAERLINEDTAISSGKVRQRRGHRPQRTFPPRHCNLPSCGKLLVRKKWGAKLEVAAQFERREYCDRTCANTHRNPQRAYAPRKPKQPQQHLATVPPQEPQNVSERANRPLPDPRRKPAHTQSGTEAGTMYRLKSKEGVPLLLTQERASGVKLPRPTKGELRAALSRALRLHDPDFLEAWPDYVPQCKACHRQLKDGRCRFCETIRLEEAA